MLLLIQRGVVLTYEQGLCDEREPGRLRDRIDRWLDTHSANLAGPPSTSSKENDSDGEEEEVASYCGRAGCRAYPHEHVLWGQAKAAQ